MSRSSLRPPRTRVAQRQRLVKYIGTLLRNVIPRFAVNDVLNGRCVHPKLTCEASPTNSFSRKTFSDNSYVSLSQFRSPYPAPPSNVLCFWALIPLWFAALCHHVGHIIRMGTQEKVIRIHARWAVTRMENEKTIRDYSSMENPRCSVRSIRIIFGIDTKRTVSVSVQGTNPYPTRPDDSYVP